MTVVAAVAAAEAEASESGEVGTETCRESVRRAVGGGDVTVARCTADEECTVTSDTHKNTFIINKTNGSTRQ